MIAEIIHQINNELPSGVRLVAVSKFHPTEAIKEAYQAGQRIFGESRMQELVKKHEDLPKDIEWHFIGHLQTNKVRYIVPFISLIESIDSPRLLKEVNKQAAEAVPKDIEWHFIGHLQTNKVRYIVPFISLIESIDSPRLLKEVNKQAAEAGRTVNVLLQLHIAQEETKFGFDFEECRTYLAEGSWRELNNVRICGLMGMASNTDCMEQVKQEFASLHTFFKEVKETFFVGKDYFQEISMGMSHDYPLAIEQGSTLIRVGSKIFGERNYH